MSESLSAASASLGVPEVLVQRSAAARAAVQGSSPEEILAAWAGDASVLSARPTDPPETKDEEKTPPVAAAVSEEAPPPAIVSPLPVQPTDPAPEPVVEPIDPVPLRDRLRAAVRIGGWAGASLGLFGFLIASAFWVPNTSVVGDGPYSPVVVIDSTALIIGAALVSALFGATIAGLTRAATGWRMPGMRLGSSPIGSTALGSAMGLALGLVAGGMLGGLIGTPVENVDGMLQLPVLETLAVMVVGGAVFGVFVAFVTQAVGVPVAVEEGEAEEIAQVRVRLGSALRIPINGLFILLLLVLPFALALIESAHFTRSAAPIVAIVTAGGILIFASLAGNRSNIRVSSGETMIAVTGIVTVIVVILSVLVARGPDEPEVHGPGGTVEILATTDLSFDKTSWAVPEGEVTFVYTDEGDIVHTLAIEGREDQLDLRVESAGDVDQGSVGLPPGTYTVYCTIKGHREAGMEGTLTVETPTPGPPEGPGDAPPPSTTTSG